MPSQLQRQPCRVVPASRPTPVKHRRQAVPLHWFGLLPVRSPLLRESSLFLGVREMFQFPRCPPPPYSGRSLVPQGGCPIRRSLAHRLPAPPQSISSRGHVLHRPMTPRHPPCARLPSVCVVLRDARVSARHCPSRLVRTNLAVPASSVLKVPAPYRSPTLHGGAAGIRTPDLRRARAALSQLSYGPPHARCLRRRWARLDSNQGPRPYQGRALTS